MKKPAKSIAAPSVPSVPSLVDILSTFAFHVGCLAGENYGLGRANAEGFMRFGLGLGGQVPSMPFVLVTEIIIQETEHEGWEKVTFDGQSVGNRHGAVQEYTKRCAEVIAWVAAHEAASKFAKVA